MDNLPCHPSGWTDYNKLATVAAAVVPVAGGDLEANSHVQTRQWDGGAPSRRAVSDPDGGPMARRDVSPVTNVENNGSPIEGDGNPPGTAAPPGTKPVNATPYQSVIDLASALLKYGGYLMLAAAILSFIGKKLLNGPYAAVGAALLTAAEVIAGIVAAMAVTAALLGIVLATEGAPWMQDLMITAGGALMAYGALSVLEQDYAAVDAYHQGLADADAADAASSEAALGNNGTEAPTGEAGAPTVDAVKAPPAPTGVTPLSGNDTVAALNPDGTTTPLDNSNFLINNDTGQLVSADPTTVNVTADAPVVPTQSSPISSDLQAPLPEPAQVPQPVGAVKVGTDQIQMTYSDGSTALVKANNIPNICNNPGDLTLSPSQVNTLNSGGTLSNGAIGYYPGSGPSAGLNFAIFPDAQTGQNALSAYLSGGNFQSMTLQQAIYTYAPPSVNNSAAYLAQAVNALGVPPSTALSSLTPAQMNTLQQTIARIEGFTGGHP